MEEFHNKTCIRFRPYQSNDTNWIDVKGTNTGCWSSVGMHDAGQIVNLQIPGCVTHGVAVHEFLHALGFYHQQSASERDQFVRINWENIEQGHESNFHKYSPLEITNYKVDYDYGSIMHYSEKAFSKNNKTTIEPLQVLLLL